MRCKIHKYKKILQGKNKTVTWKCVNCPHHVLEKMVIGRQCICWGCNIPFTMTNHNRLYHTMPNCGCTSKKRINDPVVPENFNLDKMLKDLGANDE